MEMAEKRINDLVDITIAVIQCLHQRLKNRERDYKKMNMAVMPIYKIITFVSLKY